MPCARDAMLVSVSYPYGDVEQGPFVLSCYSITYTDKNKEKQPGFGKERRHKVVEEALDSSVSCQIKVLINQEHTIT